MLKTLLERQGHVVVTASDGLEAIRCFLQEYPDLILMDVMMPNMDGIEASRHIREVSQIIPIIFVSAANDERLVEQGLAIGSDYITKPINLSQLNQKLNAHFRAIRAHRELIAQQREVQRLHDALLEENQVAAHVLDKMLSRMLPPGGSVEYTVVPSGLFSGDIVMAGTAPSGRLNIMLADAIGHGLPAAFSLMPIMPVFDAMTRKGFPLDDILFEINKTLRKVMPVGRFIAATAVSVDFTTGTCDVWVGGNPPAAILSSGKLRKVPSSHLALGIVDLDDRDEFVCETVHLQRDDKLIFWSDGLVEAWDGAIAASAGNLDSFIVNCEPAKVFEQVMNLSNRHARHDDTSLVVLHMDADVTIADRHVPQIAKHPYSRIELDLDIPQLANPDVVHDITALAHKLGLVAPNDGLFGVVFVELFANALDHGVLGLSSELKYAGDNSLESFARIREEKLACATDGHIKIEIEAGEFSGTAATRLRLVDSGAGFDQSLLLHDGDYAHSATAGRGFKLVMGICLDVSYSGAGNDVTAYIPAERRIR